MVQNFKKTDDKQSPGRLLLAQSWKKHFELILNLK